MILVSFYFIYLAVWVLAAACGILVVALRIFCYGARFSSWGMRAPGYAGQVVAAPGLSCPSAYGVLVPLPGIQPSPTALEGRFLTSGLPGKSL